MAAAESWSSFYDHEGNHSSRYKIKIRIINFSDGKIKSEGHFLGQFFLWWKILLEIATLNLSYPYQWDCGITKIIFAKYEIFVYKLFICYVYKKNNETNNSHYSQLNKGHVQYEIKGPKDCLSYHFETVSWVVKDMKISFSESSNWIQCSWSWLFWIQARSIGCTSTYDPTGDERSWRLDN